MDDPAEDKHRLQIGGDYILDKPASLQDDFPINEPDGGMSTMKIQVRSEARSGSFVSAEATVVYNSQGGYDLIWKKRGKDFRVDLDAALAERSRLEKERKKAEGLELGRRMRAAAAKGIKT